MILVAIVFLAFALLVQLKVSVPLSAAIVGGVLLVLALLTNRTSL